MMAKIRQTLSYVITLVAMLVLSLAMLASCGDPRKGLYIEFELVSTEKAITYDQDGRALLALTKDENNPSVGEAELQVRVLKGDKNLLRRVNAVSSDSSKVKVDEERTWYDESTQINHILLVAEGATAQNDSTYVKFVSVEDSSVVATLYVRVDEKATSMEFASNLEVVRDNAGNSVIKNLGIFDGVPFHLFSNKLFRFGPSKATTPNLLFSVRDVFKFTDGGEFVYSASSSIPGAIQNVDTVTGTYADSTEYRAIEFKVVNNDDKTNETFIKKFRIPVYENLSSNVLTVSKNDATESSLELQTVFEQVRTPQNRAGYLDLYIISVDAGISSYVLVTEENLNSLGIVDGVTPAYKKADVDTKLVFINNKNSESNNISLSLLPVNANIAFSYVLKEPESSYTLLSPARDGLNRRSAYYGKYLKVAGEYVAINENNFASLGIIIGQTPCYSYSRTITVVQNTDLEGHKLNSFTLSGWRESLSGTYLTFKASYEGFLIDDDITVIPMAQKTIAIEVVNYPTQMFINDKAVSYTELKKDDGTPVSSFESVEEFLGTDGSGLYYFRTGNTINSYAYTLITKNNYNIAGKTLLINGSIYDLDYTNFAGTVLFKEQTEELSVFDVYSESALSQYLFVELNGFSEGFDEFYISVDALELAAHSAKYKNAIAISEALSLVCNGETKHLREAGEYAKLLYTNGDRIYISANTSVSLNGELPIVVEAKYNSGKKLERKLVLRFVKGIDAISATTTKIVAGSPVVFDIVETEGIEQAIPASGDMESESLKNTIVLAVSPDGSATYQSLIDGTLRTYLSVQSSKRDVAKVGYFSESGEFIENQINPETLSFVVIGQKFGETIVSITSQSGNSFSFPVKVKEVASVITLNLDEDSAPANTFKTTEKVNVDPEDTRTTLTSLMVEENVSGIYVNVNVYPKNAVLDKVELFYLTREQYLKLGSSEEEDAFKIKLLDYMASIEPAPMDDSDGIDTTEERNVIVQLVSKQRLTISTLERNLFDENKNQSYICVAYLFKDENGQNQIMISTFGIVLYKAITGFVSSTDAVTSGVVSVTLLSNSTNGTNNPYLENKTHTTLSVDISPAIGTNRTIRDVIWYFVDNESESLVTGGAIDKLSNTTISYGKLKISSVDGKSVLGTYYKTFGASERIDPSLVPQDLQDVISSQYLFFVGQKIHIESTELVEADNASYLHNLRACIVDVNGIVWTVKFSISVKKIELVGGLNVYDYDEDDGIYFETAQKMSNLPTYGDGVTIEDRLARQNSYEFNDIEESNQKEVLNVSVAYQDKNPTLANLEYLLFDAVVDDEGRWSVDTDATRNRIYSSSSVWLGLDYATNKYFVTPIKYGYTILYVIPQDQMIMLNENINPSNIKTVLGAIKNSQVVKEFHITVADGYKTYIRLSSAQDFEKLANNQNAWDKNYYVTNDIDLSGVSLSMIGTEEKPFAGKITSMPIVGYESYNTFKIGVTDYYIFDGIVYRDINKTEKQFENALEVNKEYNFGGISYKYLGSHFEQGSTTINIIRELKQTSIIPSYTIYGIRLADTQNGFSKWENLNGSSHFGMFGVFVGSVEKVNFRFDSVTYDTYIAGNSFTDDTNIFLGAFAGKILREYAYSKTYETIEGYYGKYVKDGENYVLVSETNALNHLTPSTYDSTNRTYTVEAFVAPKICDVGLFVQSFDYKLTRNADAGAPTVYAGIIGFIDANNTGRISNVDATIYCDQHAQTNNWFKCVFGGLVGWNKASIDGIDINTHLNIEAKGNKFGVVGGLVGENNASISNIRASGQILVSGTNAEVEKVGGIAGSSSGKLEYVQSSVVVRGGQNVGGIVGYQSGTKISNAIYSIYAGTTNAVYSYDANSFVGGIAGTIYNSAIENSYVMSYVDGNTQEIMSANCVGGLVGQTMGVSSITKSFVYASEMAPVVGGLVGVNEIDATLTITNTFVKGYIVVNSANADNGGLLVGLQKASATVTKTYVAPVTYILENGVLAAQKLKLNVACGLFENGVYAWEESFQTFGNTDETGVKTLTSADLQNSEQIDTTGFYKNGEMTYLDFYSSAEGDKLNPWTVTEQNGGQPILKDIYPTKPTDIEAYGLLENLKGVYNISNTEIIISLSDYYKEYGNNLTSLAVNKFFKLRILPNTTGGLELFNTTEDASVIKELRSIWLNVQNSNPSIIETSSSNLYDLKFNLKGKTGTANITISCAQNTNAKITLTICVVEGFDSFTFSSSRKESYDTTSATENENNLISIQKDLSERINISYKQTQRNYVTDESGDETIKIQEGVTVVSPSHLNAGFAIMFEEGSFTFGADKFKEVVIGGVTTTRSQILQSFKNGAYNLDIIRGYYPTSNVEMIDNTAYVLIVVDGYYYAKIMKDANETTYAFVYYENLNNITIFGKSITANNQEIEITKYYIFENGTKRVAKFLNTTFKMFVKVYSGITELNVSGASNIDEIDKRAPSDSFESDITFVSDSTIDLRCGVNAKLYLLKTKTIHANNTIVYDDEMGQNPQSYSTIESYIGKYLKVQDGEFVQITNENSKFSDNNLMLIVFIGGEDVAFTSTVDTSTATRTNELKEKFLNKFIPSFITNLNNGNIVLSQRFEFGLMQQYYKTLDEVLVFRFEVVNADNTNPATQITKSVYFEFVPTGVRDVSISHYTDADLEEGDGTLASNYLTNAGLIPTDSILAGDYGLLQIDLVPDYGAFDKLTVQGIGTNGDIISFVQRVKNTYTAKVDGQVVTQTRYYLYDQVSQKLDGTIQPQAVSNYYDGMVSLMVGTTEVYNILSWSEVYCNEDTAVGTAHYYLEDGKYILVTRENYGGARMFEVTLSSMRTFARFEDIENSSEPFYYKHQGNLILVKDLVYVNEDTKKLKVEDISFDFDGTIYLQTLISKQTTTANSFNISIDVEYDGQTSHFEKTLAVDTSSTLSWNYSGSVKDRTKLVQEAYVAVGTQNENLSLEIVGTFNSLKFSVSAAKDSSGDSLALGELAVYNIPGTNIYRLNTEGAQIGDIFDITIVGFKTMSNGYQRKITRTIKFYVVDYILKNGSFVIEQSLNNILDKVYTNNAAYKISIAPNFSNIEISTTEPVALNAIESYVGYFYKDEDINKFYEIESVLDEGRGSGKATLKDVTEAISIKAGETLVYPRELKNLWEIVYELNTDKYQVFALKTVGDDGAITTHKLTEAANNLSATEVSEIDDYAFTKVQYKASTEKNVEGEDKTNYEPVNNMSKLPKNGLSYYYLKYVYNNGENNNGYYVCPLSQGYDSVLYINEMYYGYDGGILTFTGGIGVARNYEPASSSVFEYDEISSIIPTLQGIASYGTEIRFSQKTSVDNPIPVYTEEEFLTMGAGNHYILMNDLIFESSDGYWNPINTSVASLDGNGKTITMKYAHFAELSGTAESPANVGFFGTVSSETLLKNITIKYAIHMDGTEGNTTIDYRDISGLNFGLFAGTNNGIITNCEVTTGILNSEKEFKQTNIIISSLDRQTDVFKIGGLVGINNNSITNSRISNIAITANGSVAGFVCENFGTISASYANFGLVKNSSTQSNTSKTAGFVLKNGARGKILSSYVGMAYLEEYVNESREDVQEVKQTVEVSSSVDIGGFVHENFGEISDSYSAIKLSSDVTSFNASSSGFVLINQSGGKITRCYSISSTQSESFANAPFVGPNKQDGYNSLNYGSLDAFVDCYYYNDSFGARMVKLTEQLSIKSLTIEQFLNKNNYYADCFENYSISRYHESLGYEFSSVWAFAASLYKKITTDELLLSKHYIVGESALHEINLLGPQLVYANLVLEPEREVLEYDDSNPLEPKYVYTEISSLRLKDKDTKLNVRIIDSAKSLIQNLKKDLEDDSSSLSDWYRLVCDIDLTGIDLSQFTNAIFEGNFDGNGFTISGINITSSKADYCGFFGKVQTKQELVKDSEIGDYYKNADRTIASIHNAVFKISAITATEAISVGGVCGEAENAVLSNITVTGQDLTDIQIVGKNLVGGVVGKLYGTSRAYNIISEASVSAVYSENYTNKLIYNQDLLRVYTKEIDESTFVLSDGEGVANADSMLCYAGAVFGVADLSPFGTDTVVVTQSAYPEARLSNIKVQNTSKVVGGTVGGVVGLLGASTYVYNMQKIVEPGTYIKGGRFSGGLVGENHGVINYARIHYTPVVQDAVDALLVGGTDDRANVDLFRSESAVASEQAKAVGGLVGMNIGLSLSVISDIQTGVILNSYVKVKIDDQTSTYLGGLVGIALGGNLNSNFITGSAIGARVGVTGGAIGFVTDFLDTNLKQIITSPFESIEFNSFMLKDRKYWIEEVGLTTTIWDITSDRVQVESSAVSWAEGGRTASFTRFVVGGEEFYLNSDKTKVYTQKAFDNSEEASSSVVAYVNQRKFLSMDNQTLHINNVVAKNNYASTDFYRIKTIVGVDGGANGVFGAFIGKTSKNSIIQTEHKTLTSTYSPAVETKEYNFYVSQIYSTPQAYTSVASNGYTLQAVGNDLREVRSWESFIVDDEFITLNGNVYKRSTSGDLTREAVEVSNGEFSIDKQGFILRDGELYKMKYVSGTYSMEGKTVFNDANGNIYEIKNGSEIYDFYDDSTSLAEIRSVSHVVMGGTNPVVAYSVNEFTLNDIKYIIKSDSNDTIYIYELERMTMQDANSFSYNNGNYTVSYKDGHYEVANSADNAHISEANYVQVGSGLYYIDDRNNNVYQIGKYYIGDSNNIYKIDTTHKDIATGLTRFEMYSGSYARTGYNDRMFRFWNVYDYGTKQEDDTYKITNFDKAMMPIYNPTNDVEEIKIYTVEQFLSMKTTGKYRLMNDLDFEYQNVCLFIDESFSGTFIGASDSTGSGEVIHTLYNINPTYELDNGTVLYAGIFNKTSNATIEKLNISGVAKKVNDRIASIRFSENFSGNFGVLIGNAVDTQIREINITEEYNYIASYINIMGEEPAPGSAATYDNLFATDGKLYKIDSTSMVGTDYSISRIQVVGNRVQGITTDVDSAGNLVKLFRLTNGGTEYILYEDFTSQSPYSYAQKQSPLNVQYISAKGTFVKDEKTYCVFGDGIYEMLNNGEEVVLYGGNLLEIDGKVYKISEQTVYYMSSNLFKLGIDVYQIQDGQYIYKKIQQTSSDELVAQIYDSHFMLDGITYKYYDGKITALTVTQANIENNLKLDLTNVEKLKYIGGLVGQYEVQNISQSEVFNINVEATITVNGNNVYLGGVAGNVLGSKEYGLTIRNVIFDGNLNAQCKSGDFGGIVGYSKDTMFVSALAIGEMNISISDGESLASNSNIGGFAGEFLESGVEGKPVYAEGIHVLNDMKVSLNNSIFNIGGLAGKYSSSLFNSVVGPNITIEKGTYNSTENSLIAGLAAILEPKSLAVDPVGETAIQNVQVLSTTINHTNFKDVFAVFGKLVGEFTSASDWSSGLVYDQNLSLNQQVQVDFARTTGDLFYAMDNGRDEKIFSELNFLKTSPAVSYRADGSPVYFQEAEYRYTYFAMKVNGYTRFKEKLQKITEPGTKMHPFQIVEDASVSPLQQKTLNEVSYGTAENPKFLWYVQTEDIEDVDVLNQIKLCGFYNGNNHNVYIKATDGVYGALTENGEIGLFNVSKNSVISSLAIFDSDEYDDGIVVSVDVQTSAPNIKVGTIASVLDAGSVMFACYSDVTLKVQHADKPIAVGGLVGELKGQIISSGSNADIYVGTGIYSGQDITKYVGGLVGIVPESRNNANIINSFYNGIIKTIRVVGYEVEGGNAKVTYQDGVGGLVGAAVSSDFHGGDSAGTLVVENCYAVAKFEAILKEKNVGDLANIEAAGLEVSYGDALFGLGELRAIGNTAFYDINLSGTTAQNVSAFSLVPIAGITSYDGSMQNALNYGGDSSTNNIIVGTNGKSISIGASGSKGEWWIVDGLSYNSGLPIAIPMIYLDITPSIYEVEESGSSSHDVVRIKNENELKFYLNHSDGAEEYYLLSDMNFEKVGRLSAGFWGTLNGNSHKITGLSADGANNYFVQTNNGTIKNVEFDDNASGTVVAGTNNGTIGQVLLENGTDITTTNGAYSTLVNCQVGAKAIFSKTESISDGKFEYSKVATKDLNFWTDWTLVGTVGTEKGQLKLQQFNKTTSTLDVFGISGERSGDDYIIETKEQYSAVVEYLDRNHGASVSMIIKNDINFGGMNVTRMNGDITIKTDGNTQKVLSNFSMVNTELYEILRAASGETALRNIRFTNVNYYAEAIYYGPANEYKNAAFITNDLSANIEGIVVDNSLFNFKQGEHYLNHASTLVGTNYAEISDVEITNIIVNASFRQNFGLVAAKSVNGTSVENVQISSIQNLNITSTYEDMDYYANAGLVVGNNGGEINGVSIERCSPNISAAEGNLNFGGIAGLSGAQGSILQYAIGHTNALSIIGEATNVGGVVGNNNGEISLTDVETPDPTLLNEIKKLNIDVNAENIGGVAGKSTGKILFARVVATNAEDITLEGRANVGGLVGNNNGVILNAPKTIGANSVDSVYVSKAHIIGTAERSVVEEYGETKTYGSNLGALVGDNDGNGYINDASVATNMGVTVGYIVADNISITGLASNAGGMIGMNEAITVSGITIKNSTINVKATNIGGIIGELTNTTELKAKIEGLTINGEADVIGGMVATDKNAVGTCSEITSEGINLSGNNGLTIEAKAINIGGIVGYTEAEMSVTSTGLSKIGIKAINATNVGGMVGYAHVGGTLQSEAQFDVALSENSEQENFGGFVGRADNLNVLNTVSVPTTITTSTSTNAAQNVGGMVGLSYVVEEINLGGTLNFTNNLQATDVGGFIGNNKRTSTTEAGTIIGITATANITVSNAENVGGVVGNLQDISGAQFRIDSEDTINLAANNATIVGGLFGQTTYIDATDDNETAVSGIYVRELGNIHVTTPSGTPKAVGGMVGVAKKNFTYSSSVISLGDVTIETNAEALGGVVGVANNSVEASIDVRYNGFTITGNAGASKAQHIGGIVGMQGISDVNNITSISANNDIDIIAEIKSSNLSQAAASRFVINAGVGAGNSMTNINDGTHVGGVVAQNFGNIYAAKVSSLTLKGKDYVGGITGENSGEIEQGNSNYAQILGDVHITANSMSGLVVGKNTGNLYGGSSNGEALVKNTQGANSVAYTGTQNLGIAVSQNTGTIAGAYLELDDNSESYTISGNATNVGLLVANNSGLIKNIGFSLATTDETSAPEITLNASGSTNVGIIGSNTGTINARIIDARNYKIIGGTDVGAIGYNSGIIANEDPNDPDAGDGSFTVWLKSVQGTNVGAIGHLAGFAKQNGNDISVTKITANIFGLQGENVGGVIGKNEFAFSGDVSRTLILGQNAFSQNNITNNSTYVGGIIGLNTAAITKLTIDVDNAVNIKGKNYVGGFAGKTTAKVTNVELIKRLDTVGLTVSGTNYVGGWFGEITSGLSFTSSTDGNNMKVGVVGSSDSSHVGGLVGKNGGTLNEFNVQSGNDDLPGYVTNIRGKDYVGGIAGENNGSINNAQVFRINMGDDTLQIRGDNYVGGIAGISTGSLNTITVKTNVLGNGNFVGGIAGKSTGNITNAQVLHSDNATNYVGGMGNVGGIAGESTANITDSTVGVDVRYIGFTQADKTGEQHKFDSSKLSPNDCSYNVGGIAGKNSGSIDDNTLSGGDGTNTPELWIVGHTIVGGVVGYNTGDVRTTEIVGKVKVAMLGVYSGNGNTSEMYHNMYKDGNKFLGTNVETDANGLITHNSLERTLVSLALCDVARYHDINKSQDTTSFEHYDYGSSLANEFITVAGGGDREALYNLRNIYYNKIGGNSNERYDANGADVHLNAVDALISGSMSDSFYGIVGLAIGYDGRTFMASHSTSGMGDVYFKGSNSNALVSSVVQLTGSNIELQYVEVKIGTGGTQNIKQLYTDYGNDALNGWSLNPSECNYTQDYTITKAQYDSTHLEEVLIGVYETISAS